MEKLCRWCGQTKQISDFYKHPRMADGHLKKCKECPKANTKKARELNYEYYLEYDRNRSMLPHRVEARKSYSQTTRGKNAHNRAVLKWAGAHPERKNAAIKVSNAIRDGVINKMPCFICGRSAQAHHPDYGAPLDVVWLCPKHHKEAHKLVDKNNTA